MDAHDLYGLPLDRFIPERTALAKALRTAGERDEAATVAKLQKPSVAAWAVNQLVRTQHDAIAQLFEAGDAVQKAQSDLIAGGGRAQLLREAGERERGAVALLVEAARGLLSTEGHGLTQATLDRVSETLHAGALDPEAREALANACLARELARAGLGASLFPAPAPVEAPRAAPAENAAHGRKAEEQAARQAEEREAEAARQAAEKAARRAAERAAQELEAAQRRRDWAASAHRSAEEALDKATKALADAEATLSAASERAASAAALLSALSWPCPAVRPALS